VARFLELPYNAAMERWFDAPREPATPGGTRAAPREAMPALRQWRERHFERAGSPADATSVGRFRTELTADEQARFERVAGDLLADLGYVDRRRGWALWPTGLRLPRSGPRTRA
jgi:hypothetical protein